MVAYNPSRPVVYEDYLLQTGTFEGMPIYTTITAEYQKEAAKYGITLSDLIDLELETTRDWQADC